MVVVAVWVGGWVVVGGGASIVCTKSSFNICVTIGVIVEFLSKILSSLPFARIIQQSARL